MLTLNMGGVPEPFQDELSLQWDSLQEALAQPLQERLANCFESNAVLSAELAKCFVGSAYALAWSQRHPEEFITLLESGDLWRQYDDHYYETSLTALVGPQCGPQGGSQGNGGADLLGQILRAFRAREMTRLIFRDFNRCCEMQDTTRDVSILADACLNVALNYLYSQLCAELGTPRYINNNEPQQLVVIAMGKLGAHELNLSSDIDLIFAYPESGVIQGDSGIENLQFFQRLGQRLIKALDEVTSDGFVFRVDMRLRPYGKSGALVLSFDAMEEYYQTQGRDWERYAMIKARIAAGDPEAGQQLLATLRPFTYRRYIDYSAINSLRDMKAMIDRQNKRQGREQDIKLGSGGIREIEFIAQSFQLIRGGREIELQQRRVQVVLELLVLRRCLEPNEVDQMQAAYVFLRNTEHAIQGYQDKQTQMLPKQERDRARLAYVMGFDDWASFATELAGHRQHVSDLFKDVVSSSSDEAGNNSSLGAEASNNIEDASKVEDSWLALWRDKPDLDFVQQLLSDTGFEDVEASWHLLSSLRQSKLRLLLQAEGRERLDCFMPVLLAALSFSKTPSKTLTRVLPLVEAVIRRTAYLMLLMENPKALRQLIVLCEASPWCAQQLARHPVLMDELLNTNVLYSIPDKAALGRDLSNEMASYSANDIEGTMNGLRYFKLAHMLRVAANEVSGKLPLVQVSDYLTQLAETLVDHVLRLTWQYQVSKFGTPAGSECSLEEPNFIIVAYGKLGGIELSHSSDLDLVFIHDAVAGRDTDADRPISNEVFYARMGQKIIHLLATRTTLGRLYEVDMRLRPSGDSGLLVTSMKGFSDYQDNSAWTWEHQALVRARVIAGDQRLVERFEGIRRKVLCKVRNNDDLKRDIVAMRRKMRDHLLTNKSLKNGEKSQEGKLFHLKHSVGGIVDIEFIVQYAVLAWAHKFPTLVQYTDNIRILTALGDAGLFSGQETAALINAYKAYRVKAHQLALLEESLEVTTEEFEAHRQTVVTKWQSLFAEHSQ